MVIPYIITTFAVDLKNMGMPPNSNAEVNCTQHLRMFDHKNANIPINI